MTWSKCRRSQDTRRVNAYASPAAVEAEADVADRGERLKLGTWLAILRPEEGPRAKVLVQGRRNWLSLTALWYGSRSLLTR
jgi:hypothetical protein